MKNEFARLREILEEKCRDAAVYYQPNPGNLGDALIRLGTMEFFRTIGLPYRREGGHVSLIDKFKRKLSGQKSVLVHGGGGGWCKFWNYGPVIQKYLANFDEIIVLPSTYETTFHMERTTFFCRDRFESKQAMKGAVFCHDLAFLLKFAPGRATRGEGYFFRTDIESAQRFKLPPDNQDISLNGNYLSDVTPFLDTISSYERVHTDRLHVAIAAALMGKVTTLYPGAYFKNRAIYQSSLLPFFPNTEFCSDKDWNGVALK